MINLMEKVFIYLTMEKDMKVKSIMVLNKDMEDTTMPMEINTKVIGPMIIKMVLVLCIII